ncbi:peroxiredoxin [Flavobacteriaceae bacterium MAR_2010_72]|nr:peroxiredoxin [Flavobacteriaceae bacterium MAR_2010_72]TVZ59938.1 peroxiredoxin [Flavobacteriaceae bacterium MAR_2010_105]
MKNLIRIFFVSIMIVSCGKEVKSDGFVIDGNAKGLYNGIRVYLKTMDANNRQVNMDTAVVMNGTFKFEGKVADAELLYLYVNSVPGALPIMVENEYMTVTIDKDNLGTSVITGSKSNEGLTSFNKQMTAFNDQRQQLSTEFRTASENQDSVRLESLRTEMSNLSQTASEFPLEFIKNNPDNQFSLKLIESMLQNNNSDLQQVVDTYDLLDNAVKSSPSGKNVATQIENAKRLLEAQAATNIGKFAPNFSAPTPEGKPLALNDIKGKATIIDFWAAWCGPCRRENPNVVKVYEKYHDKGLEIIGVSLDGSPRQQSAKDAWLKAIEDDKLTWHHVSNLQYFNDPVAQMYNIQSIPATFILDAEGKIVAKNLRGQALEDKIAEMLN